MKFIIVFFFLINAILLGSCSSGTRLKKEVFEKVEIGMTIREVTAILGEPAEIRPTVDSHTNYFYLTQKDLMTTSYAVVEFDRDGYVCFSLYKNPS